jgi:hypothetical protein
VYPPVLTANAVQFNQIGLYTATIVYDLSMNNSDDTKDVTVTVDVTIDGCQTSYFNLSTVKTQKVTNTQLGPALISELNNEW